MQGRGVNVLVMRQVRFDLSESLAQLPLRPYRIATLVVVKGHGEVDQRLKKQPARTALGCPDLFQDFVALEEFAPIEEVDAVLEARVQVPG